MSPRSQRRGRAALGAIGIAILACAACCAGPLIAVVGSIGAASLLGPTSIDLQTTRPMTERVVSAPRAVQTVTPEGGSTGSAMETPQWRRTHTRPNTSQSEPPRKAGPALREARPPAS